MITISIKSTDKRDDLAAQIIAEEIGGYLEFGFDLEVESAHNKRQSDSNWHDIGHEYNDDHEIEYVRKIVIDEVKNNG